MEISLLEPENSLLLASREFLEKNLEKMGYF